MDTDLAAETGDKVNITNAAAGTTYIQVKDASLINGHMVTGAKNLLLITDASQNVNFVGKNLNAGGLWDVTPTLENGENVTLTDGSQGTKDQWYLTKIAKAVNNDSQVLLDAVDSSYALWRNTNDSLRKRFGELRFHTKLMKVTMTVSGHDTAVGNLAAVILTAALICISLVMIRQSMPKAFMALQLKMAAGIRVTVMAAVKTSFLQAVFMEPGMGITAAIQM